ncbi:glycosyltransferase family 2 protein [Flavobacterium sharifuzzamanii]|uniref:glycosyltransferase family 2 protein n=1 Tax=Flavobacterium sharifuzzamanii TaxID=2211133 RepID=UPI000DAD39A4|nr:glycosyltransferase family 2 protein [Flavobacterium sharifuzzamanii]KAF2081176.1 glycosyltransferase family 2 protein [Flavobacterium sharifuzzamanii]
MISVVIPVFNREDLIRETLNSLLSQTSKEWECILVDDGSTDNTEAIIQEFVQNDNRFRFYKRPVNSLKGPSSCRNIGLSFSKGEFIMFLDSDDLLLEFCIEERLKAFEFYADYDFLVFNMDIFSEKLPCINRTEILERPFENWINNFMTLAGSWQTTAPLYKTWYIKEIGGFAEQIEIFEDFEIAVNALFNSKKFKIFKNIDYLYRNDESYFLKHVDLNYEKKVVASFVKLLELYDVKILSKVNSTIEREALKNNSIISYYAIFDRYIVKNVGVFKKENKKIIRFFYRQNYIGKFKYFKWIIVQKILFRFYKIKGLGLYRLINFLMK